MQNEAVSEPSVAQRLKAYIQPAAAVIVTIGAFWMFHRMTLGVSLVDIKAAIAMMPWSAVALAFAATMASYVFLASYDIMACRIVAKDRVPWPNAAFSGMAGYAFSNFLGFHLFTGGAVRFRTYARSGLDAGEIGQIILITWMGLWLAFTALVGLALVFDPQGVPVFQAIHPATERVIGAAVVAALVALFVFAGSKGREIRFFGWYMPVPPRKLLFFQLVIGIADLAASASVLYVLLPADAQGGMALFLIVYMTAVILGAASHVPGGVGVFEATLIAGLGLEGRADILAALLAYRIIYYVVPFLIASVFLLFIEAGVLRNLLTRRVIGSAKAVKTLVPPVAAAIVFISGIVLLFSGATPGIPARLEVLEDWLPLSFVESSHFLGSLIGLALLIIAYGLQRRLFSAWAISVVLLLVAAVLSLAKGLDWEEASILAASALFLIVSRHAFYRRAPQSLGRISLSWLSLVALALIATIWLGFFSYSNVDYSNELFWEFEWGGEAPRFLRATLGLVAAAIVLGIYILVHRPPARAKRIQETVPAGIEDIVAQSPDTQANLALLGDKAFLWSENRKAFLMYRRTGNSMVSMGDPVGDEAEAADLVWQFRDMADRAAARAVFYAVPPESLPLYLDMGYALLKLGEVARVDLHAFSLEGPKNQEHRYADRRAAKEGLVFEVIPRAEVPRIMAELREVSDAWLQEKGGKEKSFSLGSFDSDYMAFFDCAVMRLEGRIVAFANIWRSGEHNEISIDLMRYRGGVSKVLMDALFVKLMLHGKEQGFHWFNLGAAPLSGLSDHALASRWNRMARLVFRHGDDFYHFEGLRAFKQKFSPVWTPQYLACPGGLGIPQVLLDLNTLISGGIGQLFGTATRRAGLVRKKG